MRWHSLSALKTTKGKFRMCVGLTQIEIKEEKLNYLGINPVRILKR
jgi:hypothetical protein